MPCLPRGLVQQLTPVQGAPPAVGTVYKQPELVYRPPTAVMSQSTAAHVRQYRNAYFLALSACMGSIFYGWDIGLIGGVIAMDSFKTDFGVDKMTSSQKADFNGNIVSVLQGGSLYVALYSCDRVVASILICGHLPALAHSPLATSPPNSAASPRSSLPALSSSSAVSSSPSSASAPASQLPSASSTLAVSWAVSVSAWSPPSSHPTSPNVSLAPFAAAALAWSSSPTTSESCLAVSPHPCAFNDVNIDSS